METADFLTVDVYDRPTGGRLRWRLAVKDGLKRGIDGLRAANVNFSNNGTHSLLPRVVPGGCALVAAWDSAEAAEAAFRGPLHAAVEDPSRYSLDGEVVRVRFNSEDDDWHGWTPRADGTEPLTADEPMVAIVHGILRPTRLANFVHNNLHAASRAAHHPGHRGSVDVTSKPPFEHTSISLWKTRALAEDYAYSRGGHSHAMKHALKTDTHRVGCFLRVRPLASTGSLGIGSPAFPKLPPANRAGL